MHPLSDPATIELRRWAVEQACKLFGRDAVIDDVTETAECLEDWVLREPEVE